MPVNLKYLGEAIFLVALAFRLLRWAWGAVAEGDAPPSAMPSVPSSLGVPPVGGAGTQIAALLGGGVPSHVSATTWLPGPAGPAMPSSAALFPPEMLAAMTPEQRAAVLDTLAKQQAVQRPS